MDAQHFTRVVRDALRKRRLTGHRITTETGTATGRFKTFKTVIGDVHEGQADDIERAVKALRYSSSVERRNGGPFIAIHVTWYV
jgi:hypothetical protein